MVQKELFDGSESYRPPKNRQEQIFARFLIFHEENPHIWDEFERRADEMRATGRPFWSGRNILENIRWDSALSTTDEEPKINNDFAPYYCRMYVYSRPERFGFFELRLLKSSERKAYEVDLDFIRDESPLTEESLKRELLELVEEAERRRNGG